MKKIAIFSLVLLFSSFAQAASKLLDKTLAIVDDQVYTHSMIKRIVDTLPVRKNISGMIYSKTDLKENEVVEIQIRKLLIRSRLTDLGYIIADDQVEGQIKETEQRLNLKRDQLLQFLSSNNFTFDEYFELVRESMEFNIFIGRVIQPLVSVTEQEIKNAFYRQNASNKMLNFKYNLVDFSLSKKEFKSLTGHEMKEALIRFQADGHLPEKMRELSTIDLGDMTEEGLDLKVREVLKKTDEGSFTGPVLMNDRYHSFYVKKKDLVESEKFLKEKDQIKEQLFDELVKKMFDVWTQREKNKHYIKLF